VEDGVGRFVSACYPANEGCDTCVAPGAFMIGVNMIKFAASLFGLLICVMATLVTTFGPEIHFDTYGFHHRNGNGLHFEMSQTLTGTNFQFGQPTPH
jgi:hypothetical protein